MIDIKTENEGRIIKISDNWCDEQTEYKIRDIMTRLNLSVSELVDWEIFSR